MSKRLLYGVAVVLAIIIVAWLMLYKPAEKAGEPVITSDGFNKSLHATDEAGSLWWIVSKTSPVTPLDYAPTDLTEPQVPLDLPSGDPQMRLTRPAATALEAMVRDAEKVDIDLMLFRGYKSYQVQVSLYNEAIQQYGQAGADKQSARPGTSEHQTGLAVDLEPTTKQCPAEECFADLPEGKWLAVNAYKYGYILRYPADKAEITGYDYQPWHIRYVGSELSHEMQKQNIKTLEEFFNQIPTSQPY